MSNLSWRPSDAPNSHFILPKLFAPTEQFPCRLKMSFSVYFDGTRNSKDEDKPHNSHSNIARLHDLAVNNELECVYRLYIQGVGTRFSEIGESEPHPDGAREGAMGDHRIRYAMLFIANRVADTAYGRFLVDENPQSITHAVKNDNLIPRWRDQITAMLIPRVGGPKIDEITLDLFGFSRGATAARSFLNQLLKHFGNNDSTFCGIPLRVRFMGLFDTVASVGLADAYPLPVDGHQYWGDQSLLTIPPCVEQCVHIVAAHENRASFPVDLIRAGDTYTPNCLEIVYPGMHADVGGGYGLRDQGKGTQNADGSVRQTTADKLSQIPLNDMYRRACKAGVPMLRLEEITREQLVNDLAISPELQDSFDTYMSQLTALQAGAPVTTHFLAHRKLYLGWRKQVLADEHFSQLSFVRASGDQERVDMIEANRQLHQRIQAFSDDTQRQKYLEKLQYSLASPLEKGFHLEWRHAPALHPEVGLFLEQYVHDSRAHFVLTDPQTDDERRVLHESLERQDHEYQQALTAWRAQQKADERAVLKGKSVVPTVPPRDPLSGPGREMLRLHRAGHPAIFSDANPGTSLDGVNDSRDLLNRYSGRREDWSYLRLRQVFAGARVHYAPYALPAPKPRRSIVDLRRSA
ncbi:T6SS phospholipase effector Tle1-like catalytic domain-containing protein [Pseudomonas sp. PS02290]|uniref:T6SS phospholipase effector Tle1-like catalytic domain-containing protein n=1 Tax=Pseudomonas sp. PS02290 TaxID=2991430 RepID=UPI002499CC83|nr:DUF2235 domain-containing protein [Pseudomonas sp. PS02290]